VNENTQNRATQSLALARFLIGAAQQSSEHSTALGVMDVRVALAGGD
jgi:hypothetical protein